MSLPWWHQLTDPRRGGKLPPGVPYVVLLGRFPCTHWQGNALEPHPDNRDHVICRMCGEILDVIAGHDPRSTPGAASTEGNTMRKIITGALGLALALSALAGCAPASGQPDGETGRPAASSGHALRVEPAAAVIPASAVAAAVASADVVPYSVGNATCPSYIGGGGGCQYVVLDRAVPGSTGTLHVVVYYNWLANHTKYNVYDIVLQNHTNRTQILDQVSIANSCCSPLSHTYVPQLNIGVNGTYDQHVAPGGSSFLGQYLATGQGYRQYSYMKNSGTSTWFYVVSDALP